MADDLNSFANAIKKKTDQEEREKLQKENVELARSGGYRIDDDMLRRMFQANYGRDLAKDIFYTSEMEVLRKRREDLSEGYSGAELGALRETARGEMAGQRSNYLKQLQSRMARGGVGGARGAAMVGAADQQYAKQGAEAERKMLLDSAQMKRQGVGDLQDFIFRQKLGETGMMLGQQGLGSADYAAQQARMANRGGGKK